MTFDVRPYGELYLADDIIDDYDDNNGDVVTETTNFHLPLVPAYTDEHEWDSSFRSSTSTHDWSDDSSFRSSLSLSSRSGILSNSYNNNNNNNDQFWQNNNDQFWQDSSSTVFSIQLLDDTNTNSSSSSLLSPPTRNNTRRNRRTTLQRIQELKDGITIDDHDHDHDNQDDSSNNDLLLFADDSLRMMNNNNHNIRRIQRRRRSSREMAATAAASANNNDDTFADDSLRMYNHIRRSIRRDSDATTISLSLDDLAITTTDALSPSITTFESSYYSSAPQRRTSSISTTPGNDMSRIMNMIAQEDSFRQYYNVQESNHRSNSFSSSGEEENRARHRSVMNSILQQDSLRLKKSPGSRF